MRRAKRAPSRRNPAGLGVCGSRRPPAPRNRSGWRAADGRSRRVTGVAAQLIGRVDVVADVHARFFGFDEEFARGADAESVIRRFDRALIFNGVFVDHLAVLRGEVGAVVHIPAERLEEGIEEFLAELGFVIMPGAIERPRVAEAVNEGLDDFWRGHVPAGGDCVGRIIHFEGICF